MWDQAAQPLVESGQLKIVGVVQEQHAERARLYKQWRKFDWPILQDSITQLGLAVVPVPVLIDEHGVVRSRRPRPSQLSELVAKSFPAPEQPAPVYDLTRTDPVKIRQILADSPSPAAQLDLADALLNYESDEQLDEAIRLYRSLLEQDAENARLMFRLGVAHRKRFDSDPFDPTDFAAATDFWTRAVEANPNQYIWRRRIQQYGPRLIKPYPFYDWVEQAVAQIKERGDTPIALSVPLSGAEIAQPQRQFQSVAAVPKNPDLEARVSVDVDHLIQVSTTGVPAAIQPGQSVRIHVRLVPANGKWNNESGPMQIWIDAPESGQISQQLFEVDGPSDPESREPRVIEFEVMTPESAEAFDVQGYALYYACRNDDGQCLYLRQNFQLTIPFRK